MKKNKPIICFFGTYDKNYTSNRLILSGLRLNNVMVHEVNAHIEVTRLDSERDMTWWELAKRVLKKYRIIPTTIRNWDKIIESDIIYVGYPGHFDVFFAAVVAKLASKKLIFNPLLVIYIGFSEEQGILNKKSLLGKAIKYLEGLAYSLCDLIFADTPFQEKFFKEIFHVPKSKLHVLALGADDEYYQHTPYVNTAKKLNVIYYGLYSPIHGVPYIIEAANKLKNNDSIHFTMVGNGNTFKENFDKAKSLKLRNITFHHDVPIEKHPAIIEKGDIFLGFLENHSTVERVIPNKVYQGLALNKVVLTADSPVIRSVFENKINIYTIKPANANELTKALLDLKEHPELRKKIANNGYELFKKEFTPKAVGRKMLAAINTLNF